MTKTGNKKFYIFLIILIPILLELTIFNFNFYSSLFYKNKKSIQGRELNYETTDSGYILTNIDSKVQSMYFDIINEGLFNIRLTVYDDAHEKGYVVKGWNYFSSVKESHYFKFHSYGKVSKIVFAFSTNNQADSFVLNDIVINGRIPFSFNIRRVLLITFILTIIYLIKMKCFKDSFDSIGSKTSIINTVIIICVFFIILMTKSNYYLVKNVTSTTNHSIYQELTKSLAKGHFYLDLKPSEKLLALNNPYDATVLQSDLSLNEDYYLDYAFYNGKYYCYFGIVPVLLTYLPVYLITHTMLNNTTVLCIGLIMFVIGCFTFIYELFKKYFKDASCLWYLTCSGLLSISSGAIMVIKRGYFYGIPVTYAVAFTLLGLTFWLKSIKEDYIDCKYLAIGSTCMALVSGCRPQLLLYSALALVIFYEPFKEKKFKLKQFISLFLPYIIIGILAMYYNYARFGSVFDFGAKYNLTSNDMTKRGFNLDRILDGIFAFLFEIPHVNTIFPFIQYYDVNTVYMGETISEIMCGGLVSFNIFAILGLVFFLFKKEIKNKTLYWISFVNLIVSLIIIIVDTEVAGIIPRYIFDFSTFIVINAIIVLCYLKNFASERVKKLFAFLVFLTIIVTFLLFFTDELININYTECFYIWYHTIMFWI